jgi:hypothetical protein
LRDWDDKWCRGVAVRDRIVTIHGLTDVLREPISELEEKMPPMLKAGMDSWMRKWLIAASLAVIGAAVTVSPAQAQGHGGIPGGHAGRPGPGMSRGGGGRGGFHGRGHGRRFYGSAGYWPYFYSDFDSEQGMIEAPPPPYVGEPSVPPTAPAPAERPADSVLLELQDDHWVRITNYGISQSGEKSSQAEPDPGSNVRSVKHSNTSRPAHAAEPAAELPPAVLVFRDGHKEEIRKYVIVGSTLYTTADYWSSGSWTRKVQIAELDVAATLGANRERGTKFSLPSGPTEVMFRP